MKQRTFSIFTILFLLFAVSLTSFAHGGRTDSSGGHKDNKNKSGLGYYHYHCGGHPPHLHTNGVCPYKGGTSSSGSRSSGKNSSNTSVPKTVYATRVNVSNMPSAIKVDESVELKGATYPSNAEDQEISWESSDTSIATIDSNGLLKAVGVGTVTISAKTSRGTTSRFNLIVNEVVAERISINNKQDEIIIGRNGALSVTFTPKNTTYKDIDWKSANENIISIDKNGNFTALAVGKTTITAIHKELTDSFEIEVKPILAESIKISCINKETGAEYEELRFEEGKVIELSALVLPVDTTDTTVKWSVDNTDIATVDEIGTVTTLAKGNVIITAETVNGITDTIEIEIYNNSMLVKIIVGIVVSIVCFGIAGLSVFLVIWNRKRTKL